MIEYKLRIPDERVLRGMAALYQMEWAEGDQDTLKRLKKHATYPGYRCVQAYDQNQLTGFVYAYTSQEGQYYHDLLQKALSDEMAEIWLADCFEFVELIVHPMYRRRRIAKKLISILLENIENKTAVITTQKDNLPAIQLYKKLGFSIIHDAFYPGTDGINYVILGKENS